MSAMSASSAAPASLMPLSLIAEHKSSQPPPGVQSLPRSGSDKCVAPSNLSKPTANGMEGSGPLPLVSQVPQTATSLPAMPELNTANSDSVQLSSSHSYQSPHQNLIKPSETGLAQESSGGIVTTMLSGERRHTEETIHHHQISSSTVSTFSSVSTTTTTTTTEQHSRSAISAQLLQLQPSQPGIHQSKASSVPNISSDSSVSAVGNAALNATQIMPTVQPESAVTPADDSTTRILESTQTQITLDTTNLHKQMVQPPSAENAMATPPSAQQPSVTGQTQAESSHPVATNVNTSPKSSQLQVTQTSITVPTTSMSSHQTSPSGSMITATSVTPQPPSSDNSNLKVATLPRQTAKKATKGATSPANPEPSKKLAATDPVKDKESGVAGDKPRRKRLPTQPYQSPIPELNIMAKYKKMKELNEKDKVEKRPSNSSTDKLIVFYRNEFLAVRNAEGGFYVCQAMQNVYKSSSRIRIRWLSQQPEPSSDLYTPDFYDHTEFDCILTNLNLERVEKDKFRLPEAENRRTESILQRALDVERGVAPPPADDTLTETHPDGLDLSLYRNEEQLKKRKKNKKKIGKKKELSSGEEKHSSTGASRRRAGAGGGVSASAVAKAKKAAAIKRTAAVKRVVQQAAAARRQVPVAVSSSTISNKKSAGLNAANTISSRAQANTTAVKKDTKVNAPTAMGKRKGATPAQVGLASEKRTRRSIPASQQQQTQQLSTTSSGTQAKARGIATASNNSSTNKNLTSNNNGGGSVGGGGGGGGGTNTSNGNNNTAAGGTRRTLRNSK